MSNSKEIDYLKNQYLNVGLGIHAITITSFLQKKGVPFRTSEI